MCGGEGVGGRLSLRPTTHLTVWGGGGWGGGQDKYQADHASDCGGGGGWGDG